LKFQYITSGINPGHGDISIKAINAPVSVAGMDIAPGERFGLDVLPIVTLAPPKGTIPRTPRSSKPDYPGRVFSITFPWT
jgi:hypothetical protein